jgi:HNH endonuclease
MATRKTPDSAKLDRIIAEAGRNREQREQGYREQAIKLYPWVCTRCAREFNRTNLQQLTVHHKDHNHDNNPPDGSNWELLCIYCTTTNTQGTWIRQDASWTVRRKCRLFTSRSPTSGRC